MPVAAAVCRNWFFCAVTFCASIASVSDALGQWVTLQNSVRDDRRYDFTKITCFDSLNCTVVGFYFVDGELYANNSFVERTTDGGQTWKEQTLPLEPFIETVSGPRLRTALAIDSSNVILAGDFGIVLSTTNAGHLWESISHKDSAFYALAVSAFGPRHILVGGYSGKLKVTSDRGSSWTSLVLSTGDVRSVKMWSETRWDVFATGKAILYRTSNAGKSWDSTVIFSDRSGTGLGGKFLRAVSQLDELTAIAVGGNKQDGNLTKALILRTSNGGLKWDTVLNGVTHNRRELMDVVFVDSKRAYAAGGGKWLLFSNDGGVSWHFDTISDAQNWSDVRSIAALASERILVSGAYGFYSHLLMRQSAPETASIERMGAGESISVYPNPARNEIAIDFAAASQASQVSVVDCLGRVCALKALSAGQREVKLDISHLPQGMFYVKLGNLTRRIIKLP